MALVLFTLPLLGAVTLGEAVAVLGTIASFLLNHPHQQQPTFKAMTSCWGDPWPITYNLFRCAGKIIQASVVQKHSGKKLKKGLPTYSQTICVGFGEGPRSIGRIWADGKVIYDPRPIVAPDTWQANTPYGAGDVVIPTAGGSWQFTATVTADSGVSEPSWNSVADAPTADGSQVWIATPYVPRTFTGKSYNYSLVVYAGDEIQLPDSALEQLVGVGNQSAYRGLVYIVLEDFDLSKYGNRIPNFEAELMPPPSVPFLFSPDSRWNGAPFRQLWSDPDGQFAYFWGNEVVHSPHHNYSIIKVSLTAGNVVLIGPTIDFVTYGPDISGGPVGSLTGEDLWQFGFNYNTNHTTAQAWDKNTLALGDTWDLGATINPSQPIAVNGDGTLAVGINFPTGTAQEIVLINLETGAFSVTDVSTVGGPANYAAGGLWVPQFDNSNHIWIYDDHSKFWEFTVTTHGTGAPTVSAGTSYVGRANDGAQYGTLSFNPDTGIMYAWSKKGTFQQDMYVIPIDTVSKAVGAVNLLTETAYMNLHQGDTQGWHRGRYAATYWSFHNTLIPYGVGRYDYLTGTLEEYDWFDTWGMDDPVPPNDEIFCAAICFDGTSIVSLNADTVSSPPDANYYDCWFFPLVSKPLTLEDICIDISERVGLAGKYDYSELASVIPRGAGVLNRQKAREFLEAIMPAYFYDLTDIGPQVIGTLRTNSTLVATVPEDDLGAATDPSAMLDRIASMRTPDLEIPRDMSVSYYDYNHDYQAGSQPDRRSAITQYSSGSNSLNVPVVMTPGEAANMVARVLYQVWIERTPRKASLPLDYIYVTPADIIDLVRNGEPYRLRVTKARFNPSQVIDIEGVSEDLGVYNLTAGNPLADIATGAFVSQTIVPIVMPALAIMDTAPLRDTDVQEIGTYAAGAPAIYGGGFDAVSVQASVDNSVYNQEALIDVKTTMGTADTVLANHPRFTVWDRVNTVDVTLLDGALGSASEANLINYLANLFWSECGEIFQAKTVTPLGGQSYRLSNLLRGRYGTEAFTGSHFMGEQIVAINTSAGADIAYGAARIGQPIYWKGVNDAATGNETTPELLTMTTRRLMPFAPYFMRGARDGSSNLTITGLRRMRWRGRPLWTPPETDLPVTMEIDIYNGLSVVRTLTSTLSGGGSGITNASGFTAYYSAADQTADFGSPQAAVSIIAYQLNSVVGRGYGGSETV